MYSMIGYTVLSFHMKVKVIRGLQVQKDVSLVKVLSRCSEWNVLGGYNSQLKTCGDSIKLVCWLSASHSHVCLFVNFMVDLEDTHVFCSFPLSSNYYLPTLKSCHVIHGAKDHIYDKVKSTISLDNVFKCGVKHTWRYQMVTPENNVVERRFWK